MTYKWQRPFVSVSPDEDGDKWEELGRELGNEIYNIADGMFCEWACPWSACTYLMSKAIQRALTQIYDEYMGFGPLEPEPQVEELQSYIEEVEESGLV